MTRVSHPMKQGWRATLRARGEQGLLGVRNMRAETKNSTEALKRYNCLRTIKVTETRRPGP